MAMIHHLSKFKKRYFSHPFFQQFPILPYLLKWLCIALLLGLLVGSASAGFLYALDWVTNTREQNLWLIAGLPLVGFVIGWVYMTFAGSAARGNNLLLENIHEPGPKIPFRMAPLVFLGTLATHLFGGSAGREGTALQMAGAIADQLTKPLGLSAEDRKLLLLAAIAAGFGAVFGTPMAGAVFALEVFMVGKIRYNALFVVFVAAVLADWVAHLWQAPHTHYIVSGVPDVDLTNLIYTIIAGILFGWCAAFFSKGMHWMSLAFQKRIAYPPFRPMLGGAIIVVAVWLLGTTDYIGLGIPTIVAAFEVQALFYVFLIKILLTVITLSAGFKGGEVTPLFFIGATLGSALSLVLPLPTALLAGMGFVAVFAGATNTPLACTFMAIELFGAATGIYAAIACVVAYLSSGHTSIYGKQKIGEPKHLFYQHFKNQYLDRL